MKMLFCSAWLLVLASMPAAAASDCADLETQSGMNQCGAARVLQADGALNAAYNQLSSELGEDGKRRLRDAQRAWIDFRDSWCDFESMSVERGSMHPLVVAACRARLTEEQSEKMIYQLTCNEDTNCARLAP
jgi:uncharacterized protein YecT (DUF1311 family)